jgi:hypothetical protein
MKLFAGITGALMVMIGGVIILIGLVGGGDNARVGSSGLHGWECTPREKTQVCEWTGPSPGEMVSPMVQVLAGGALTLAGSILLAAPVLAGARQQQQAVHQPQQWAPAPPMR